MGKMWENMVNSMGDLLGGYLPNVIAALAILVVGWIVAKVIAAVVRAGLRKTGLSEKLGKYFPKKTDGGADAADAVGKGVFYLVMLFVLVAFFQTLQLTLVTQPLNAFLTQIFEFAPRLFAAGILLLVAWIIATVLKIIVSKALAVAKIDERLSQQSDEAKGVPLTKTLSEAVYWLVFLLFLPGILDALAMPGLLEPVNNMLTRILAFLPNLFAAAIIFVIGWFVARIIQRVVGNLLAAVGVDSLSEKAGLNAALGDKKLSGLIALVLYVLILLPVVVASLNALQIDAVTQPASQMLNTILGALPGIFAAFLVVAIAYVVGKLVSGLVANILAGIGFNKLPAALGIAKEPAEGQRTPAELAGTLLLVAIIVLAVMQAVPMMGFDLLASMMSEFVGFAGHVLLGIAMFALGLYLAKLVADAIRATGIAQAGLVANVARVAVLVLAGAMGLRQMGLADEIVNLAFGLTLGSVAIAAAIAFGIGGRDAAKSVIDGIYKSKQQGE